MVQNSFCDQLKREPSHKYPKQCWIDNFTTVANRKFNKKTIFMNFFFV